MADAATALGESAGDWAEQSRMLAGVSRTFALTIPQLPDTLERAVGNGYLLCRLADTIEDDPGLGLDEKSRFHERLLEVLRGEADAGEFAADLGPRLSGEMLPAERELVASTPLVISLWERLEPAQRRALLRCVTAMCHGMPDFQRRKSLDGLDTMEELDSYCYVVAGVVGEMLTELFCAYSPEIARRRNELIDLALCFGQGLQMTNILKDVWEDRNSGSCWLPRTTFRRHGKNLGEIIRARDARELSDGIGELVGIAHAHLRAALDYTLLIPRREIGIRRFCLWAIGLAILTLQNIYRQPGYRSGDDVKVSRRRVRAVILICNSVTASNLSLRSLFAVASHGLPCAPIQDVCDPERVRKAAPVIPAIPTGSAESLES